MKSSPSFRTVCESCGRPVTVVWIGDGHVLAEPTALVTPDSVTLARHRCVAAPPEPDGPRRPAWAPPRGRVPVAIPAAMEAARSLLAAGPRPMRELIGLLMAQGLKHSTARHALARLGVVKSREGDRLMVGLP